MSGEAPEQGGDHLPTALPTSVQTPRPGIDAFISYASQDAPFAIELVRALEGHGLRCWIAPRDVRVGALYAEAIVRAIGDSKALVVVLSEGAIASSHVGKEIERASSKKRPIIALRIDDAPLTPALEYFLSESQWLEVRAGDMESLCGRLIEAIREPDQSAPRIDPATKPGAVAHSTLAGNRKPPRSRIILAAGLVVVAVALVATLVSKFGLTQYHSAKEPPTASNLVNDKSIAVLPFADMSEKHDQEYFADGMAEEILDLLAKIPALRVIGRTSSFQFKGKNEDLRTIGTQLNAAYVLEGSVRKAGDQVRITAQLINTKTGTHEWSETYDRQIRDVLKLQDAIAAAIVRELQLTVASRSLNARSTLKSAEGYDLYLRGRYAYDRIESEGFDEAAALFQQSLNREPASGDATVWLAWTYLAQGEWAFTAPTAAFEKARAAATAALRLDPKNADAHAVLGAIHLLYDWDWAASDRELQLAFALAPTNSSALGVNASLSLALGHWDDALRQMKAALTQDPLDPANFVILSIIQMYRANLPEAEAAIRRTLDILPNYSYGQYYLGLVLLARGDQNGALVAMQQETEEQGKQQGSALVYHALGRKNESDAALVDVIKRYADRNAFGIAEVYAFRGQPDDAMHWLELAYTQKDSQLYLIKGDPLLKSLAQDVRFTALLRKMHLTE